ncbi:hypothetical protein HQ520_11580, partial [bacterium]|nr:hypothetical protein [bacterium]
EFGKAELVEWRTGQELVLVEDVHPEDSTISVESVDGLPLTGAVQVGDERFEYDALDHDRKTLGRLTDPLRRPEAAWHDAGSPARLIPAAGFEWLVAGHLCRAVEDLRADDIPVPVGQYAAVTEEWRGETLHKVVLAKWPAQVSYSSSPTKLKAPPAWTVDETNQAIDPGLACDGDPETTFARIDRAHPRLAIGWQGDLSEGEKRYGLLQTAGLRARISADRLWDLSTQLTLRFIRNDLTLSVILSRPSDPAAEVTVPSHTHGTGPASQPLTADSWTRPVDLFLDLTSLLEGNGDWDLLDGSDGGFRAEVEMIAMGDTTEFHVHDLVLETTYRSRARTRMASRLTAQIEGVEESGTLLDNPAGLIRFLLKHPAGIALDPDRIDEGSFTTAAGHLDSLEYRFSNRLESPERLSDLLRRLLYESRSRLIVSGDRVALIFDAGEAEWAAADFVFDGGNILRGDDLRLERESEANLLRATHLHFQKDFSGARTSGWRRFLWTDRVQPLPVFERIGHEWSDRLEWHNHNTPAVIADLARHILGRHGFRRHRVRLHAPLSAIRLEAEDRLRLVEERFPLALEQGRVASLSVPEAHLLRFDADFPDPGYACWRHDESTVLRHRASGRLIEIRIEGRVVATIRWDGLLRLRGRAVEKVNLPGTLSSPIEYRQTEDRLFFGTGSGDDYVPRFALDQDGNLLVSGEIVEQVPREDVTLTSCLEVSDLRLAKGIAETIPVLVYEVVQAALQLRGELAEEERFF